MGSTIDRTLESVRKRNMGSSKVSFNQIRHVLCRMQYAVNMCVIYFRTSARGSENVAGSKNLSESQMQDVTDECFSVYSCNSVNLKN